MKKFIFIIMLSFVFISVINSFAETNISGTWQTNWGPLYLEQKNNTVLGTYEYNNGKLKGTISANKLTFTWSENSNNNKYTYSGTGYFILKKDNSLYGQWKNDGSETWEGEWTATRSNTKTI